MRMEERSQLFLKAAVWNSGQYTKEYDPVILIEWWRCKL